MKEIYPPFCKKDIRIVYSKKIKDIFTENKLDWITSSAILSDYIFIGPELDEGEFGTEAKWYLFENVSRIGVNTKEGNICLNIISYHQMENSKQESVLQSKGYIHERIEGQSEIFQLTKPLKSLESLISEINEIIPILLKKD